MGLFIGAVTGPDADGMPAFSEPMAAVVETDVQTAPAPEQPIETILASITPSAGNPDPVLEKKRSLKVRNGDTLMSIMLSAGIAMLAAPAPILVSFALRRRGPDLVAARPLRRAEGQPAS